MRRSEELLTITKTIIITTIQYNTIAITLMITLTIIAAKLITIIAAKLITITNFKCNLL